MTTTNYVLILENNLVILIPLLMQYLALQLSFPKFQDERGLIRFHNLQSMFKGDINDFCFCP